MKDIILHKYQVGILIAKSDMLIILDSLLAVSMTLLICSSLNDTLVKYFQPICCIEALVLSSAETGQKGMQK